MGARARERESRKKAERCAVQQAASRSIALRHLARGAMLAPQHWHLCTNTLGAAHCCPSKSTRECCCLDRISKASRWSQRVSCWRTTKSSAPALLSLSPQVRRAHSGQPLAALNLSHSQLAGPNGAEHDTMRHSQGGCHEWPSLPARLTDKVVSQEGVSSAAAAAAAPLVCCVRRVQMRA